MTRLKLIIGSGFLLIVMSACSKPGNPASDAGAGATQDYFAIGS